MRRFAGRSRQETLKKVEKINAVGLKRVRRYMAEHSPRGVKYFERNCAMIRDYCIYGGEHCAQKYGVSSHDPCVILRKYYNFAIAAEREDLESGDQTNSGYIILDGRKGG